MEKIKKRLKKKSNSEHIIEYKRSLLEKINKMDKHLARLIKKNKNRMGPNKSEMKDMLKLIPQKYTQSGEYFE